MKENMLIASLALVLMGVNPLKTAKIMAKFPGVPHRLEYFHKKTLQNLPTGGTEDLKITKESFKTSFLFYNDSAATVPDATIAALSSFTDPIHLISGGTDKSLDFTELAKHVSKAKSLYLLAGSGTELLIKELDKSSVPYFGPFPSLDALLARLKEQITSEMAFEPKEIILFSPGTASFGMFKNEFDRGNTFKKLILELF
jgi:UDP-N-acetylmuramoylalanine--D-glutamate ligase